MFISILENLQNYITLCIINFQDVDNLYITAGLSFGAGVIEQSPLTKHSYPQDKQENNFLFCRYFSPVAVCYVALPVICL